MMKRKKKVEKKGSFFFFFASGARFFFFVVVHCNDEKGKGKKGVPARLCRPFRRPTSRAQTPSAGWPVEKKREWREREMSWRERRKKRKKRSRRRSPNQGHRPLRLLRDLRRPRSLSRRCRDARPWLLAAFVGEDGGRRQAKEVERREKKSKPPSKKKKKSILFSPWPAAAPRRASLAGRPRGARPS